MLTQADGDSDGQTHWQLEGHRDLEMSSGSEVDLSSEFDEGSDGK